MLHVCFCKLVQNECNPQTAHDSQKQNKSTDRQRVYLSLQFRTSNTYQHHLGLNAAPNNYQQLPIPLRTFPDDSACRINTVPCSLPCLQCCGIISGLFVHRGISSHWHGELVGNGHPTSGQLFFNRVGMKCSVWDKVTHTKCTHISFMKDTGQM